MALQIKRGTNAFRLTQTLLAGEPFFVTDAVTLGLTPLWIGNGTTLGGVAAMDANTLNELTDVNSAVPVNKDVLQYNSSTGTWNNSQNLNVAGTTTLTGGVTASGAVTVAGALTVAGVLNSTGGITGGTATLASGIFSGDVSANNLYAGANINLAGNTISGTSPTINLFNDYNHTSINIGNAATGTVFLGNTGNTTTVKGALTVGGNLTVNGTTTSVNSTVVNVKDEMITLNFGETGTGVTPSTRRAGIQVDRGTSADVSIQWNEQTDKWELTNDGTNYSTIALGLGYTATTDIAAKSVSTTDYLKVANTGTTNYISQTTAEHTAKWTLDDTPDTYKLSLDNADKITVSATATTIVNPTNIIGNTAITGNATVSGSLTASSLSLSGDTALTGTLRTGNNIVLNSAVTGAPSSDATITVERGTSTDATFGWSETYDWWNASNDLYVNNNIIAGNSLAANGERITLNNEGGALNGGEGLYITRPVDLGGQSVEAKIIWNETNKQWQAYSPQTYPSLTRVSVIGAPSINELPEVLINAPTSGQVLVYNGTKWANSSITSTVRTSISAGTGISYNSSTGVVSANISSAGTGLTYNSGVGSISLNDSYAQTLARSAVSAGTGISYNSSTGVISLNSGLDPLTDVAVTSVAKGQLLSYNGTQWVNTNTLSADSTANRLNLEINSSTAGVTNAMVMRKNFGATNYANDDGTGIRFEVDSVGQPNAVYAGINATYDTALPSFNFSTTIDNGANYTDALNLNKDLARFAGSVKIDGNKIYDSTNAVALEYVRTGSGSSAYNTAKFNTGANNYGLGANFLNLDSTVEHNTKTLTTTTNTIQVLDGWPIAGWRSAKYIIQISNGNNHQMWEGMMIHDGTNIKITAYGDLRTGTANLATVSAGINTTTGQAELRVTPANASSTKFKASKMLIAI